MNSPDAALPARRAAPRTGLGYRVLEHVLAEGLVVAGILLWWAASYGLPDFVMPSPWSVAKTLARLFYDPSFLGHTVISTVRVAAAVFLALVIGSALALLPRVAPVLDVVVHGRIKPFLNSFPSLGWAILAVIWFEISDFTVVFVQVMILIPFCLINIAEGLRELDQEALEMARSFTRSRAKVFVKVIVPMLVPYAVSAVRISYGVAWKIALVAELFGADSGLGYLMLQAQTAADAATVFATCFSIVVIFIAGEKLVIDPLARIVQHK
jgi:NitT/TauT family transport system permease protein